MGCSDVNRPGRVGQVASLVCACSLSRVTLACYSVRGRHPCCVIQFSLPCAFVCCAMSSPEEVEAFVSPLKVNELKEELKRRGLSATGNKATLAERLKSELLKDESAASAPPTDEGEGVGSKNDGEAENAAKDTDNVGGDTDNTAGETDVTVDDTDNAAGDTTDNTAAGALGDSKL